MTKDSSEIIKKDRETELDSNLNDIWLNMLEEEKKLIESSNKTICHVRLKRPIVSPIYGEIHTYLT